MTKSVQFRHPDGAELVSMYSDRWFEMMLDRLKGYHALGDRDRLLVEAEHLVTAIDSGKIPYDSYVKMS